MRNTTDSDDYRLHFSLAMMYLLRVLIQAETNEKRQTKKRLVLAQKHGRWQRHFGDKIATDLTSEAVILALLPTTWEKYKAMLLLIDLTYCDPFAPYELKFKRQDLHQGLCQLAQHMGLDAGVVENIEATYLQAHRSQWRLRWKLLAMFSVFGLLFLFTGKGIQFVIRQTVQSLRGGFSALTPDYGLSLLSGGNLAIFGEAMAGGLWLVNQDKLSNDSNSGLPVPLLFRLLQSQDIKQELIKFQVTFKWVMLEYHYDEAVAMIETLSQRQDSLAARIEREKDQNEKRAKRITEIKSTYFHVQQTLKWARQQLAEKQASSQP